MKGKGVQPPLKSDFNKLPNSPSKFQLLTQEALNDNLTNDVVKYRERKLGALQLSPTYQDFVPEIA